MPAAAAQICLLALAECLSMSLWFSASAVTPALSVAWNLGPTGAAWLTAAVQLGFVAGALASAVLNLPDRVRPRMLFAACSVAAAGCTILLALVSSGIVSALVLRFLTGAFLAGVYPPGMQIAAGHVGAKRRGLAIGTLVGALTLGSATPHLLAAVLPQGGGDPTSVLCWAAGLALVGAVLVVAVVRDGPHLAPPSPFDPTRLRSLLASPNLRRINCGYLGHMWELYAFWTWLPAFLIAGGGDDGATARWIAWLTIGVAGCAGAVVAGTAADRLGRIRVTVIAMAFSGACCLLSPIAFGAETGPLLLLLLPWGAMVIADSAQFSAAVTEWAPPDAVGTALTLQTCMGFGLTLVPIWCLPWLAEWIGWRWTLIALAPGPLLGCFAMLRVGR